MPTIELGFGKRSISFDYSRERFAILEPQAATASPLNDIDIGRALDEPIDSPPLDEVIEADDRVLIVVSDATRATGSAQIVNLLVRRLIQNGVTPSNIAIIFATGIHRPVRQDEKLDLLTPFIAQRIRTIDHDAGDPSQLIQIGVMNDGSPIRINRALKEYSKVILTGAVGFHYFAGFTGGRKSICPGLASAETIRATHMLALDFEHGGRRAGVGSGLLDRNAVNEACEHVAALIEPAFLINVIVDKNGRPENIFAGHWRAAHRAACASYLVNHSLKVSEKREIVIVSCGGLPYDLNMIQAHKALDMAAHACADNGTIVFIAECSDGLGRPDFLKWFAEPNSSSLETRLRSGYEVNGQTAWTLLTKTERFSVHIISSLDDEAVRQMRMKPAHSIEAALANIPRTALGYIMPCGVALLPTVG